MTDTPGGAPPGGPVSDRMQALLSRAVEEQVSEQRAVSSLLTELRVQVTGLTESVRLAASDAAVERLGGTVSTVVADLRTSTSLLGQRIEALSKRIESAVADTAAPTEQAAVRLAALSGEIAAQADAVEQMQTALEQLAGFPTALAAVQRDVAGLHDRLQPLTEVRSALNDLGARTAHSLDAVRPQLEALQAKVEQIGVVADPERLRDAVVDALAGRFEKLEQAAERPVVGPEVLRSGLGDLRASVDSALGDRFEELSATLGAVENRLGQVGERLSEVGDAAGGIPALATDVNRLAGRVEELQGLRDQVAKLAQAVAALQHSSTGTALTAGLAALRDDVQELAGQLADAAPPPLEQSAALVSQRVADRLVETLAPRIADVVLTRVSATLVTQLGEALAPRVKADTELVIRTATADSERRVLAHVDEAVLALAEALLRRRRGSRSTAVTLPRAEDLPAEEPTPPADATGVEEPAAEPVQDIVDKINAVGEPDPEPAAPEPAAPERTAPERTAPEHTAPERTAPERTAPADPAARSAVTTGLAPAAVRPAPAPKVPPATEAATEPAAAPAATASPAAEPATGTAPAAADDKAEAAPEKAEAAPEQASGAPEKTEPAPEAPAQDAPAVAKDEPAAEALQPAVRSRPRASAPPKKASRPVTKPPSKPILDRARDLKPDDLEQARPTAHPRPPSRPAPPPTPRHVEQVPQRPTAPPPAPAAPPAPAPQADPPRKRKPWWRPGG